MAIEGVAAKANPASPHTAKNLQSNPPARMSAVIGNPLLMQAE
jgi:hypothetical protein